VPVLRLQGQKTAACRAKNGSASWERLAQRWIRVWFHSLENHRAAGRSGG